MIAGGVMSALDTVNRSCSTPGKIQPCGTLAEVDKVLVHASDLTVQTQIAVRHADQVSKTEAAMLPAWNARFTDTLDSVNGLTATLSGTAQAATVAIGTANTTIAGLKPLEDASTLTVGHVDEAVKRFDAMLADPNLALTMQNVQGITATTNHMLFTADAVETKATKSYLHPSMNPVARTWEAVKPFIVPAAQVGAAIALH